MTMTLRKLTLTAIAPFLLITSVVAQPGAIDATFNVGTGANSRVAASALQLDGQVVIAGAFTTYNGATANRVARLKLDGTLDAGFTPGAGANAQVNGVAIGPDGKAVIGGTFTTYGGTGRNRIARLNTDGTLDGTFAPGTGFNGTVSAVAVQPDGKVIVVGDFTSFNGTGRNRIARLNTNGTLDAGFTPGTGANFLVTCVALQADGMIIIGGYFNTYNGNAAVGLARVSTTGAFDGTFNLGGAGVDNAVASILLQTDGKAVVSGLFTTYNGTGRNRIMRLNTNGSLDTGFVPGTGMNNWALSMALQSDGNILLGGEFTTYNGSARTRLARITPTGALDATWTAGANNAINTVLWIPQGRVVVGGLYTSVSAVGRNRIVRLKAVCADSVRMVVTTDGNASETKWEIIPQGYAYAACSGSGFPNNAVVSISCCLADGCYRLHVMDSGGDGITNGGYVLSSENGDRIIDNAGNFATDSVSAIANNDVFCIPLSTTHGIYTSCDKLDWVSGEYYVCGAVAAVSAEYGGVNAATSGYEFWIYNPNGGYNYRRFRSHTVSDSYGPANANRACHMRINNWAPVDQIPANVLMNVRVRTRIAGANGDWGPACRFKIDPVRAACPLTKLMDIPGNPFYSCDTTRAWGAGNYVHARPVAGANKYQFRFRIDAEGFLSIRTSNTYFLQLNWVTNPLQVSKTYDVEVRASKDGGATWCIDTPTPTPGPGFVPWGDVCKITITTSMVGGEDRLLMEDQELESGEGLVVWPNPTTGDRLDLRIEGLSEEPSTIDLVVLDAMGRLVYQSAEATSGSAWSGHAEFAQGLASGTYVVQVTQEAKRWTERFMVADQR
ncbi:MAG: T9SS type A sorting domain-containing protein [Flavobacteriales bacterium]